MGVSDSVAIDACEDEIRALRARREVLVRRKHGLQNLQDHLGAFQGDHLEMVGILRNRFADVQFAGRLSDTITGALYAPTSTAADSQLSYQLEMVLLEISRVDDRIESEIRRKALLDLQY